MSTTTPYATQQPRRKPSVEVYFVLYLTAIILLLGTTPSKRQSEDDLEEAIIQLIDTDFEVDVQKIALIIPYVPVGSSADPALANNKDTLNLIRAHGTFEDVRFRIVSIVDTLDDDQKAADVATLVSESDTSVRFQWTATTPTKPAVFLVAVEGEASPIIPDGVRSDELRERIEQVVSERGLMKDTAYFSVTVHPVNSREDVLALRSAPFNRQLPGDDSLSINNAMMSAMNVLPSMVNSMNRGNGLSAFPVQTTSYSTPGGSWRNVIQVLGASDMKSVNIISDDDVRISSRGPTYIEVTGRGPVDGTKQVSLTISSPQGNAYSSFMVQTRRWPSPVLKKKKLYIGKTYSIDLTTSEAGGEDITVDIYEDGRMLSNGGSRSARFTYVPSKGISSVRFVRKVNGEKVDEVTAPVEPLPKADIKRIEENENEMIVETTVYGDDNTNVLRVAEGNAREQEIPNSLEVNSDFQTIKKRWRVVPIDPDKPFTFVLHAWDERGREYKTIWNHRW